MAILRQAKGDITASWNGSGAEVAGSCVYIPVSDAGSITLSVAGTPTPNMTVINEGYDGNQWVLVQAWDPISASPGLGPTVSMSASVTRLANVVGFSSFRVRCSAFTSAASIILTADSDVISVPPMLGATQGVQIKDATGLSHYGPPTRIMSAASTNDTLIKSSTAPIYSWDFSNDGAAKAYVKLYNKSSAPTAGDTPAYTIIVPAGGNVNWSAGGGFPMRFSNGLGIRITGGMADADTTAVAANQVSVTIGWN